MGQTLSKEESLKRAGEMFPALSENEINDILSKNKYDIYGSVPLLSSESESKEEKKKKLSVQDEEKKNEQLVKSIVEDVNKMKKEEIVQLFEENQNDPNETIKELVSSILSKKPQNLIVQQDRFVNALLEQLPHLTKEEITNTLQKIPLKELAVKRLIALNHLSTFNKLNAVYGKEMGLSKLLACIKKANWKYNDALGSIDNWVKKKLLQIELDAINFIADSMKIKMKEQNYPDYLESQAYTIQLFAQAMQREVDSGNINNDQLHTQAKTIQIFGELLQKEVGKDNNAFQFQSETICFLAKLIEAEVTDTAEQQAPAFLQLNKNQEEQTQEKNLELAKSSIQPLLNDIIQPTTEVVATSESDSLEIKVVEGKLHATVSLAAATRFSWIGFFKKGSNNTQYLSFNWLSYLREKIFICDHPTVNGEYEFRVFKDKTTVAFTKEFKLEEQDSVVLSQEENEIKVSWKIRSFDCVKDCAWVSVHKSGEERANYYLRSSWVNVNEGSISFKKFDQEGEYEARVYSKSYFKNTLKLKSNILAISN